MSTHGSVNAIVAINTFAMFLDMDTRHDLYFNSPDMGYFDGSALGYWRRKALELGASEEELASIERDHRDRLEYERTLRPKGISGRL